MEVAVCLLTYENQILIVRRSQRMLHGLYVFMLIERETDPARVQVDLAKAGLICSFLTCLGTARHAFTHRIWNMNILHYRLMQKPDATTLEELESKLVNKQELITLPMPIAMKAAIERALALSWQETAELE